MAQLVNGNNNAQVPHDRHQWSMLPPTRTPSNVSTPALSLSRDESIEIRCVQEPAKQSLCSSLRREPHWKCLLLSLLITGCLAAIIWCRLSCVTRTVVPNHKETPLVSRRVNPCEDGYIYIPVAFITMLYLVYLVECWHSHTRIDLQGKVDVSAVYQHVGAMQAALPVVWWKALCYHYVRRTRHVTRYRNGDAFTSTQVYYERINSHTASSAFNFAQSGVKDLSKKLVNIEKYPVTKIRITKGFSFACTEAEREFERQRAEFFHEQDQRDDYMESREGMDLLNVPFRKYMIAFADPHHLPWYVSHLTFWVCSLFMLSWPLRVLIEYKTAYVHYHVHKHFGHLLQDSGSSVGHLSRVSTMGSSDLEQTIRSNYTMVPSYSEALLIDSNQSPAPNRNGNVTPNGSVRLLPMGASVSLHNGVSSANQPRTLIVANGKFPNGERAPRQSYGTHANSNYVQRIPPTRSTDNILCKLQTLTKKKRHKRRHSLSEMAPGKAHPGQIRVQPRPGDIIMMSPQAPRRIYQVSPSQATTLPPGSSYSDVIAHTQANRNRCDHMHQDCPLKNSPYRRREAGSLRLPGKRSEIGANVVPKVKQSQSEGRLSLADLPPCYEDAVAMGMPIVIQNEDEDFEGYELPPKSIQSPEDNNAPEMDNGPEPETPSSDSTASPSEDSPLLNTASTSCARHSRSITPHETTQKQTLPESDEAVTLRQNSQEAPATQPPRPRRVLEPFEMVFCPMETPL